MTTLKVGIASYKEMKARIMAVARGERRVARTGGETVGVLGGGGVGGADVGSALDVSDVMVLSLEVVGLLERWLLLLYPDVSLVCCVWTPDSRSVSRARPTDGRMTFRGSQ